MFNKTNKTMEITKNYDVEVFLTELNNELNNERKLKLRDELAKLEEIRNKITKSIERIKEELVAEKVIPPKKPKETPPEKIPPIDYTPISPTPSEKLPKYEKPGTEIVDEIERLYLESGRKMNAREIFNKIGEDKVSCYNVVKNVLFRLRGRIKLTDKYSVTLDQVDTIKLLFAHKTTKTASLDDVFMSKVERITNLDRETIINIVLDMRRFLY